MHSYANLGECGSLETCSECICGIESNDGVRGCGAEYVMTDPACPAGCASRQVDGVQLCYCGPFQLTDGYFQQCTNGTRHVITEDFLTCVLDEDCAKRCVVNYLDRFANTCGAQTCRDMFQLHRNGPNKCRGGNVLRAEARALGQCCDTPG